MSYYHRLTIWTSDDVLFNKYTTAAATHNSRLTQSLSQSHDFNSGIDLIVPTDHVVSPRKSLKLSHQIVCKMTDENGYPCGYYLYPRSSISKTTLRMANSVGIIDSGYRGEIIGVLDNISDSACCSIQKHTRLFQICAPNLGRVVVTVLFVDDINDLQFTTDRGNGGFGSTG